MTESSPSFGSPAAPGSPAASGQAASPQSAASPESPAGAPLRRPGEVVPGGLAGGGMLTFVGTATVLLRFGELALLTDPNFLRAGQRAYLGKGMWSRRLTDPALAPAQLPKLAGIVLSHLHGDHWDRVARRQLDSSLPVFTTTQAARRLTAWHGFRAATPMPVWHTEELSAGQTSVKITAVPGEHARGPMRRLLPQVMGSVLEFCHAGAEPVRVYLSGDTLPMPAHHELAERFPSIDLAVLHVGGTIVLGQTVTMDADLAVELLEMVRPVRAVPVHYDDYPAFKDPLDHLRARVAATGWAERVEFINRGDGVPLADR